MTGRKWFERLVGWTFAFIVYKPVAAILYATGLTFMQEDTDGLTGLISGVALMCAASVAAGVMGGPSSAAAVTAMRQGGR